MGVILVLILLGFFLEWDKRIVSIISIVFGILTTFSYSALWWGTPRQVLNSVTDEELVEKLEPVLSSFWSSMVGIGTKVGFILGLTLLVMGIISCFVGKTVADSKEYWFSELDKQQRIYGYGQDGQQREYYGYRQDDIQQQAVEALKPPEPKYGQVKCTLGVALGQGFKLPEDRKVIVGKSPQNATLVIHDQHISNVHCSIRYREATDSYIVKDHSTNGTFVQGARLPKEVAMEYPAGTVLSLADGTNKITLG